MTGSGGVHPQWGKLEEGHAFGRLLEMLVGSVLLYGVEVWGCRRQLRPREKVQMRAVRMFMGGLHPLASQQFEMNMLPVK